MHAIDLAQCVCVRSTPLAGVQALSLDPLAICARIIPILQRERQPPPVPVIAKGSLVYTPNVNGVNGINSSFWSLYSSKHAFLDQRFAFFILSSRQQRFVLDFPGWQTLS